MQLSPKCATFMQPLKTSITGSKLIDTKKITIINIHIYARKVILKKYFVQL